MTQPISTTSTHSVLQLQQYLNLLSRRYPFITPVRANGQYDQATQQAVMQFQRELHPPVTGVVDQGTWNAIQKAAKAQDLPDFAPRSLRAFPPTANVLPDTHHSYMRVPQAMFQALLLAQSSPTFTPWKEYIPREIRYPTYRFRPET